MSERPFISVVMPVYNAQLYLAESIESILNQKFTDLELIIVDDCSQDGSRDICLRYAEQDNRVRLICLSKNVGAGMARNEGIKVASGIYLAFVDSDDSIKSNLFEKAVELSDNGQIDMVVWGVTERFFNKEGKIISENPITPKKGVWRREEIALIALKLERDTLLGYQCNKLYKKEIVQKYKIYFEKSILYEDFFFTVKMLEYIKSIAVLDTAGYYYNKRFNGSITTKFVHDYYQLSRRRVYEMYRFCQMRGIQDRAIDVLGNIYLRYILSGLMRNSDSQSGMTLRQRRAWVIHVFKDELYWETAGICNVEHLGLKFLRTNLNKKRVIICVFLGKAVFIVKKYGPFLFEKIKRK